VAGADDKSPAHFVLNLEKGLQITRIEVHQGQTFLRSSVSQFYNTTSAVLDTHVENLFGHRVPLALGNPQR